MIAFDRQPVLNDYDDDDIFPNVWSGSYPDLGSTHAVPVDKTAMQGSLVHRWLTLFSSVVFILQTAVLVNAVC